MKELEEMGKVFSAEREALASEKVEIMWIVDLLARNGVQWPNRSDDISDTEALSLMWNRIIREHLAVAIANRKKKEQP